MKFVYLIIMLTTSGQLGPQKIVGPFPSDAECRRYMMAQARSVANEHGFVDGCIILEGP